MPRKVGGIVMEASQVWTRTCLWMMAEISILVTVSFLEENPSSKAVNFYV